MNKKFRLISEIKIFILENNIFMASPDNKSCINKVKSLIPKSNIQIDELQIEVDDISARINLDLEIFIKSSKFPGGVKREYKLVNYDHDMLGDFIVSQNISNGNCSIDFEPAIDDNSGLVILVNPVMSSYSSASNEMIRRLNCKMLKKTKNYIPGHRYDSEDDTIFYLGKVYSHILISGNSDYIEKSNKQVYLFTRDIKSAKSISDVLNSGVFYTGDLSSDSLFKIEQLDTLKLMVDSGEALINDYTTFEDYKENLFKNSLEVLKDPKYFYGIKTIFDVFKYSEKEENSINPELKKSLIEFLERDIHRILYLFWNSDETSTSSRLDLSNKTPREELVERFTNRYFTEILDSNIKKHNYYRDLINDLNIDFSELISNMFSDWDPSVLDTDFDLFVTYSRGKSYSVKLRTERSSKYSSHLSINKLGDTIKDLDLLDCIKEICDHARSNYGVGCNTYEKINVGTVAKPLIYENITITVFDIISYYEEKGIEIPQNLKNSILFEKFARVNINVDLGGEIE